MNQSDEELQGLPHVRTWLQGSQEVRGRVDRLLTSDAPEEREWLTERVNILVQMKNLLTYP
jgi:carbonic anhydrase